MAKTGIQKAKSQSRIGRASLLGDTITVKVGTSDSTNHTFQVHRNLLCGSSPFFKAACKDEWKQADVPDLRLPEDDSRVFQHFLFWLYTGILDVDDLTRPENRCEAEESMALLLSIYFFADKIQICQLKDQLVEELINLSQDWFLELDNIDYVYRNTLPDSKLRSWIVDEIINSNTLSFCPEDWNEDSKPCTEFYQDLAKRYANLRQTDEDMDPYKHRCRYHEHGEDEPCPTAT